MGKRRDIRNLTYEELGEYFKEKGTPAYRAKQTWAWIYQKKANGFDDMSNLSQALRQQLQTDFKMEDPLVKKLLVAKDKTKKFLIELFDGEMMESVLIPHLKRQTLCVSTQVGCKYRCRFCASGQSGWRRDLSCAEIVSQLLIAQKNMGDKAITHVVFMGVGEPLANYNQVLKAVRIINSSEGLKIAARRITISTCGLIPQIKKLSREGLQIELSVSLHGSNDAIRNKIMPINRKYAIGPLMRTCAEYIQKTRRQVTFEYILIKDLTCTVEAAREVRKLLKGMNCKVNLIPYNTIKEFDYIRPPMKDISDFKDVLDQGGIPSTMRTPRGCDIAAACGQLRREAQTS